MVSPVKRAISPGCGVITRIRPCPFNRSAIPSNAFSASASATMATLFGTAPGFNTARTNSEVSGLREIPGPIAITVFRSNRAPQPASSARTPIVPASVSGSGSVITSGMKSSHGGQHRLRRGDRREPRARSQRGKSRHGRRTGFAQRSANYQHMPIAALIRFDRPRSKQCREIRRSAEMKSKLRDNCLRQANRSAQLRLVRS